MKKVSLFFVMLGIIAAVTNSAAQEVKINSNMVVESDGTIRLDGASTVWEDLMVFPDATTKGGSNPPLWGGATSSAFKKNGSSQGVFLWMFSASTEQELYFIVQIPHSYKAGSDLHPHVHWTTTTGTPSGTNVVWGLEYNIVALGGTFSNTTILTSNTIISAIGTPTGTGQHLKTAFGSVSGTNIGISSVMICRLFRAVSDPSDTFANEVGLLGFDIHYEKDTEGSRTEFMK
jgi:hypothetical protein